MIKKIDHFGIAVHDIDEARQPYEALGLSLARMQEVPNLPKRVAFLPVGDVDIELLQPTEPGGDLSLFLAERGEGIHHICFEVEDIDATVAAVQAMGMQLLEPEPRQGASGRIAFLHPDSANGVLIEFVEKRGSRGFPPARSTVNER